MVGRRDEDKEWDKRVINQILITGHKQGKIISGRQPNVGSCRICPFTEGTRDGISTSPFSLCNIGGARYSSHIFRLFSVCVISLNCR